MSQKEIIELPTTKHLYEQTGFSEAVKAGNLVFISGQVGGTTTSSARMDYGSRSGRPTAICRK
jgi:enamine deaminase RidA (YjgF/YER057c/UK114 family)